MSDLTKVPNPEEVQDLIDRAYNLGWEAGAKSKPVEDYKWLLGCIAALVICAAALIFKR